MFIADLHIHSKYSRATSRDCEPEMLEYWARRKGIHLIGTGDFTHPAWRRELQEKLIPAGDGLYALRAVLSREASVAGPKISPQFIVSGEISSIYKKNGKVYNAPNVYVLSSDLNVQQHIREAVDRLKYTYKVDEFLPMTHKNKKIRKD